MGTISSLTDRLARKSRPGAPPIVVTTFGFAMGADSVAWQAVAEIWGCRAQPGDEGICLEFSCQGRSVRVDELQEGFAGLAKAMVAVFPSTGGWRQSVMNPTFDGCRTLLFRRG